MARKRKRTAWHAVDESRPNVFQSSHTTTTCTTTTIHITVTAAKPTSPSAPHPTAPHPPAPQPPPENEQAATPAHTQTTAPTTPLVVTTNDIAAARQALDLTPRTPASTATVFLSPGAEQEARALLSSTRRAAHRNPPDMGVAGPTPAPSSPMRPGHEPRSSHAEMADVRPPARTPGCVPTHPASTPVANRRLSTASLVTPIPLNLESSDSPRRKPLRAGPPSARHSAVHPSPITPAQRLQPDTACARPPDTPALFTTGAGKPLHVPNALFATGRGDAIKPPILPPDDLPLFTTGAGRPVAVPRVATTPAVRGANSRVSLLPPPGSTATPRTALLQTATPQSGLHTPSPASRVAVARQTDDTLSRQQHARNMFATARGRGVLPSVRSDLLRDLVATSKPTPVADGLRKVLFVQGASSERRLNANVTGRSAGATSVGGGSGRRSVVRPGKKTSAFKMPRTILHTEASVRKPVRRVERKVVRLPTPLLRKDGRLVCARGDDHACTGATDRQVLSDVFVQSLAEGLGCLKKCLDFKFCKDMFGSVQCLPVEVVQADALWKPSEFSVTNCMDWIGSLFAVDRKDKPMTSVGSASWTKLCYALAVWKLSRLHKVQKEKGEDVSSMLTATNVVRELLKRIQWEWHDSRQPWLLRVMREDTNARSHLVLKVADFSRGNDGAVVLILTDGWYIARARIDAMLTERVLRGWIRIGDKLHISGAGFNASANGSVGPFGDGDELDRGILHLCKNGVLKAVSDSDAHMGMHRMLVARSLKWIVPDGGTVVAVNVVVLRSYPPYFVESVEVCEGEDGDSRTEWISRRAEGEDAASSAYEHRIELKRRKREEAAMKKAMRTRRQRKQVEASEEGKAASSDSEEQGREVSCVQEMLVCGVDDDPNDAAVRKLIRMYKCSPDLQSTIRREGATLRLFNVKPRHNGNWVCPPDGIAHLRDRRKNASCILPRDVVTVADLKCGIMEPDGDFDGTFYVVYITPPTGEDGDAELTRFMYLVDDLCDSFTAIAVELCRADARHLPKVMKSIGKASNYPLVTFTDLCFQHVNKDLDIVHSKTTFRTNFVGTVTANKKNIYKGRVQQLQARLKSDEMKAQLEIVREAIISFSSGNSISIADYFTTSTQET